MKKQKSLEKEKRFGENNNFQKLLIQGYIYEKLAFLQN